ncbi:phage tail spike protein [Olsenella phocaeensis]|uniref:phage tail spike protein n=1 Tax=Olsenella phocaeensis TaxID=1852385 RepID=UPI003A903177
MAGAVPTLHWFDRFDERIGVLAVAGALVHTEELGGEDTLEFECRDVPAKGDRLVWHDDLDGRWREFVVVRTDEPLEGLCSVYAESSLCELLDDFIEDTVLANATATRALTAALANSRWAVGACGELGRRGCWLYHVNALAALRRVCEVWGGEASGVITVADGRVTSRTLSIVERVGAWRGARFTYGKNLARCTRTVLEDEVYTALYGFGAGLPNVDENGNWTGGYRRKLTFGSVNNGVNWVGDEQARLAWGRWNADRTAKVHSFGQVTFSEIEDPTLLLAVTRAALADCTQPKVSYDIDVALVEGDVPVMLGDTVAVIDTSRDPE